MNESGTTKVSPYFREERWGGEREGGLSPYFNSRLIRVLVAKHLPCSSPTPIHITTVLLHP